MKFRCALLIALLTARVVVAANTTTAPTATGPANSDIDSQYEDVLSAMKLPPVSGVLVTEIAAGSAAGAAGLRAGDIITNYYGTKIADLATLRQSVADALARRIESAGTETPGILSASGTGPVLLTVRRAGKNVNLQVPRQPLGVRAIEVQAGIPAPRNPPPSPRGSITLHWPEVINQQDPAFFRLTQISPSPASVSSIKLADVWIGWRKMVATSDGPTALTALTDDFLFDADNPPPEGKITQRQTATIRLRLGDYATTPPILIESAQIMHGADEDTPSMTAQRIGESLQVRPASAEKNAASQRELPCPLTSIPQEAIGYLAAALPQEPDTGLALNLLSLQDFVSRPGYILITRGRQPLPSPPPPPPIAPIATSRPRTPTTNPHTSPPPQTWRVDLLHCGVRVESYFLSDDRQLLLIDDPGPTPLEMRRVMSESVASTPLEEKPATVPASHLHSPTQPN